MILALCAKLPLGEKHPKLIPTPIIHGSKDRFPGVILLKKTERITRRHTPREAGTFRVYGQPTESRFRWHVHKSSLPKEETSGDTSETRTRNPMATVTSRELIAPPPMHSFC